MTTLALLLLTFITSLNQEAYDTNPFRPRVPLAAEKRSIFPSIPILGGFFSKSYPKNPFGCKNPTNKNKPKDCPPESNDDAVVGHKNFRDGICIEATKEELGVYPENSATSTPERRNATRKIEQGLLDELRKDKWKTITWKQVCLLMDQLSFSKDWIRYILLLINKTVFRKVQEGTERDSLVLELFDKLTPCNNEQGVPENFLALRQSLMERDFPISHKNAVQALALLLEAHNAHRIFANEETLIKAIRDYIRMNIFSRRSASEWSRSVRHFWRNEGLRSRQEAQVAFCKFVEQLPYRNSTCWRVTKISESRISGRTILSDGYSYWLMVDDEISILELNSNPVRSLVNMDIVAAISSKECLSMEVTTGIYRSVVNFKCENPIQVVDKIRKLGDKSDGAAKVIQRINERISSPAIYADAADPDGRESYTKGRLFPSDGRSETRDTEESSSTSFSSQMDYLSSTKCSYNSSLCGAKSKHIPFHHIDRKKLLNGRYSLEKSVGSGNNKVFSAEDKVSHAPKIVKFYDSSKNYKNALRNHEMLNPEKVCRCTDAIAKQGDLPSCIILEKGHYTLQEKIKVLKNSNIFAKMDTLQQVVKLVEYLHDKDCVYGDLKPSNIVGFGIANAHLKFIDVESIRPVSSIGRGMFTKEYAAPEIMQRRRRRSRIRATFAQDMWSVGAIAFEIFTGERIFPRGQPQDFRSINYGAHVKARIENGMRNLGAPVRNFISNLLTENPKERMTIKQALNHEIFNLQKLFYPQERALEVENNYNPLSM